MIVGFTEMEISEKEEEEHKQLQSVLRFTQTQKRHKNRKRYTSELEDFNEHLSKSNHGTIIVRIIVPLSNVLESSKLGQTSKN